MTNPKKKRRRRRRRAKKILIAIEIIVILILVTVGIMAFMPNAKVKLIKALVSCSPGQSLVACIIGDDYEKYIQDSNFNSDNIFENTGLEINGDYTNIALFGGDSREGDIGDNTHGDSIIVVSVNNKTGDVKMVSVYRDTALKYTVDGEVTYGKATEGMFFGGIETTINMLNENLDLNITDYVMVNFAGLTNIVDAMDGLDINITEDERITLNDYLVGLRESTGLDAPDVKKAGEVHLTGLQVTAYCRIRYVSFTQEDGTVLNNDYGRAGRQRFVIQKLLEKAKTVGATELLNVTKTLFKENTGDNKFLSSSLKFNEILKLLPIALECNIVGQEGFPTEHEGKKIDGKDCVIPKDLVSNVSTLHEYLFEDADYQPTDAVQTINNKLIKLTGVKLK